ncbi:hypothetical protein NSQ62_15550 [Solibacillus sp. FSL H8-0523]
MTANLKSVPYGLTLNSATKAERQEHRAENPFFFATVTGKK